MHSHSWLNLIMLVTILALAAFLYIRPSLQEETTHRISTYPVAAVQHLQINRQDSSIELNRTADRWYMSKPIKGRVNESKIDRILEILSANSQHLLPFANLDRYGLQQPMIELHVDQESFKFGDFAPITNEQYLATRQQVFLVSPRYAASLSVLPTDLLSLKLLAEDEMPVEFILSNTRLKHDEGWQLIPEQTEPSLSQTELNQWAQAWRFAQAIYLTLASGQPEENEREISILLHDGRKIKLIAEQNDSELTLLRVDEGVRYHFPVSLGKRLLDPYTMHREQAIIAE